MKTFFDFGSSLLFLLMVGDVTFSYGAKILGIFPLPLKSHFATTSAVMKSLADVGHEVTMVTPFPSELSKENFSSIIDTRVSYSLLGNVGSRSHNDCSKKGTYESIRSASRSEENVCDKVFNSKAFQDELLFSKKSFDVVFVEIFLFYKCYLPIAKKLKAPVIGVVTTKPWDIADLAIQNIRHLADVPEGVSHWRFDDFYYRLYNLWTHAVRRYVWPFDVVKVLNKFHRDNADKLKPYEGYLDIEPVLIFSNGHHSILPRASNPNVIEIGGIQVQPAKPLPQKIQKFIDEADHGVILFTFGSIAKVSSLSADVVNIFLEVFRSIPQRVLWKFEGSLQDVPNNVMVMDWLPQRDILEHVNVRAFISHCGLSGMYEAIYTATPIISCPLMFDQPSNAAILEHLGVAVHLDIESVTKDSLLSVINSIFNDTRYFNKMQSVSQAFKERPLTPQQSVVFWTEYVIKYKDTLNLMPPSSKLNWFQYYLLDIFSLVVGIIGLFLYLLRQIVKFLINILQRVFNLYFCSINKFD
ncbi:UDP-glucosyltransferase 2-like [Planococcus citri]|uniref:UDP-glucosyltransferase 2-like n=1 Tax=Planococcus citri TaxID=170843 RepID=UPI0031F7A29E